MSKKLWINVIEFEYLNNHFATRKHHPDGHSIVSQVDHSGSTNKYRDEDVSFVSAWGYYQDDKQLTEAEGKAAIRSAREKYVNEKENK